MNNLSKSPETISVEIEFVNDDLVIHYGSVNYTFTTNDTLVDENLQPVDQVTSAKIIYHVLDKMNLIDKNVIKRLRDCVSVQNTHVAVPRNTFEEILNTVKISEPELYTRLQKLLD